LRVFPDEDGVMGDAPAEDPKHKTEQTHLLSTSLLETFGVLRSFDVDALQGGPNRTGPCNHHHIRPLFFKDGHGHLAAG
jgi:hypothetical protein